MKLPDRPNLRHLRDQAKDLVRAGATSTLADAQLQIARQYGFASWPRLKQHVESLEQAGKLKHAIACNDVSRVEELLESNAALCQLVRDDEGIMPTQPGRIPMMELLLQYGADVNGRCWGWFPVLFFPCENLEPEPLLAMRAEITRERIRIGRITASSSRWIRHSLPGRTKQCMCP